MPRIPKGDEPKVLAMLKPGDVINSIGHPHWWTFWLEFTCWAIQRAQKKVFGAQSNYKDTHSMLFFDPQRILSVTAPRAKWEIWDNVAREDISVYRPTFQIEVADIDNMKLIAEKMLGYEYDVGQLLDIALAVWLGYDRPGDYVTVFGRKGKFTVCSAGVRSCFEFARKDREKRQDLTWKRLWEVDVEATMPAHFANSPALFKKIWPIS